VKLSFWAAVIAVHWRLLAGKAGEADFAGVGWTRFCIQVAAVIMAGTAALLPATEVAARFPNYAMPLFAVVLSNRKFRFGAISVSDSAYLLCCLMLFLQLGFLYSGYSELYYPFRTILTH
jgi:hypothetical protein